MTAPVPVDAPTPPAQLFSLAAHELRTPMGVVAGYLKMLLGERGGVLAPEQRRLVEAADRSAARIVDVLAELSDLARLDAGLAQFARGPADLGELLHETVQHIAPTARRVFIDIEGFDAPTPILVDADRLRRALRAVVDAVVRETPDGERVSVRGLRVDAAPLLAGWPSPLRQADRAADGSAGGFVAVDVIEARFDPILVGASEPRLAWLDETRGGLGLALPIARRLFDAEGGALWSPANRDQASGFAFVLPVRRT